MKVFDAKATGENIKQRCEQANITPKDLSRLLNLDASTPYYWFQGKSMPRMDVACALADMLKCSLDDLFIMTDDEEV